VKRQIHYLNTDLDLIAEQDLNDLAAALDAQGVFPLHVDQREGGRWHATFETGEQFTQPEANIVALLTAIESLDSPARAVWSGCSSREFNIGYDCGDEPWAFNQQLTPGTLARMAALGISLRITLYPAEGIASQSSELSHDT
jgi:hypothetical protein